MPQCTHIKIAGTWTDVRRTYIKVGGTWERVTKAYEKLQGTWHQFCHLPAHAVLPVFTGAIADIEAVVGEAFTRDISPNYATGDRVNTYTLENAPTGMAISNAGLITWPSPTKVTASGILVKAINAGGETVSNAFGATAVALGPELVAGGTFDGVDGDPVNAIWTQATTSIDNNRMKLDGIVATTDIAVIAGRHYAVTVRKEAGTAAGTIRIGDTGNAVRYLNSGVDKLHVLGVVASVDYIRFNLYGAAGKTVFYDDISVREILP